MTGGRGCLLAPPLAAADHACLQLVPTTSTHELDCSSHALHAVACVNRCARLPALLTMRRRCPRGPTCAASSAWTLLTTASRPATRAPCWPPASWTWSPSSTAAGTTATTPPPLARPWRRRRRSPRGSSSRPRRRPRPRPRPPVDAPEALASPQPIFNEPNTHRFLQPSLPRNPTICKHPMNVLVFHAHTRHPNPPLNPQAVRVPCAPARPPVVLFPSVPSAPVFLICPPSCLPVCSIHALYSFSVSPIPAALPAPAPHTYTHAFCIASHMHQRCQRWRECTVVKITSHYAQAAKATETKLSLGRSRQPRALGDSLHRILALRFLSCEGPASSASSSHAHIRLQVLGERLQSRGRRKRRERRGAGGWSEAACMRARMQSETSALPSPNRAGPSSRTSPTNSGRLSPSSLSHSAVLTGLQGGRRACSAGCQPSRL